MLHTPWVNSCKDGLLTSLTQSLGIKQLLSQSSISNINEVITNLATLLKALITD
jgi:hypothetical protein